MLYNQKRQNNRLFIFGHRGAPRIHHENTIKSINKSIKLGVDGVEVDIQTTSDNKIILFHDEFIINKSIKHSIKNIKYKKLVELCKFNKTPQPDLMKDLICVIKNNPQVVFNIEIKSKKLYNYKILDYILNQVPKDILFNQCILSSFNFFLLIQLKFIFLYKGPLAFIIGGKHLKKQVFFQIHKLMIIILDPIFLHVNINFTTEKLVKWVHHKSKIIHTYTINDKRSLDECMLLGVDGVFTDNHEFYRKH